MSRSKFFRFVLAAFALFISFALLAVDSRGLGKGKDDDDRDDGKGQTQIVRGCITKVTLASGTTLGTVEFTHPKFGVKTVKVTETGTAKTAILVCGKTKTLAELKTLVEAVKTGEPKYCGTARVDNLTSLMASKINVCNEGDEKDEDENEGKKVGQNQIVHGCITKVTAASGKTLGTVEFTHPKFGGTVKVTETGTAATVILVCGKTKTLAELKTLVEAVKKGEPMFCGIARVDDRTSLMASKIIVCNDAADDD